MTNIRHTSQRILKPRVSKQSPLPIRIHRLSFLYTEGTTQILIHPSKILMDSKQLLNMIEEKKDIILLENGLCAFRKDIFQATEAALEKVEDGPSKIKNLSLPSSRSVPKRPTNAFIIYRNALRTRVKRIFPEFDNSQVSKFLGAMWNNASSEIKERYEVLATECRRVHKEIYPDFEYNPKREALSSSETLFQELQARDENSSMNYSLFLNDLSQNGITDGLMLIPDINEVIEDTFLSTSGDYDIDVPLPDPTLRCNENCCSTEGLPDSSEWNLLCNIVTDLFPESLEQSQLIDEMLWSSLENMEQYQHTDGFNDSNNGNYFEIFDSIEYNNNITEQEGNNLGF
ncbi:hypothetical protein K501DRAFT_188306 [Backusella circina FSU 941]|nr:hypothetical protein K501DRAFT_188306 [Backusella circina FSU 941]